MLGYLLAYNDISKRYRYLIYILAILGLLLHIFGTYYLSIQAGEVISTYKGYLNVPCVLYSVGVFVFFKYHNFKLLDRLKFSRLSSYSFPVYLIHFYVIDFITEFFSINTLNIIYRIFAPFLIISICIIITFLMRKIPVLKNIVP